MFKVISLNRYPEIMNTGNMNNIYYTCRISKYLLKKN